MLKVSVINNVQRFDPTMVSEESTIREILTQHDTDFSKANVSLDGAPIKAGDLDKPLGDFGLNPEKHHFITAIVKTDNA